MEAAAPGRTIEDLADEAMEGWDKLLGPTMLATIREHILELYETHPVMRQLAQEALLESRQSTDESGPVLAGPDPAIIRMRKLLGGD